MVFSPLEPDARLPVSFSHPIDTDGVLRYELDLTHRDNRIVANCLLQLANKEPGENITEETFSEAPPGKPFQTPPEWLSMLPDKGIYCCVYQTGGMLESSPSSVLPLWGTHTATARNTSYRTSTPHAAHACTLVCICVVCQTVAAAGPFSKRPAFRRAMCESVLGWEFDEEEGEEEEDYVDPIISETRHVTPIRRPSDVSMVQGGAC